MPSFFHKPENALKRANEFIEVDKRESALEVLNDVIRSRKHRQKWTSVHEDIMFLYTKLCVQLQRSSYAKDGLYQYRNICKEVAPNSFEKVITSFLKLAEGKADEARQKSEATVLQEIEDLDVVMTPESLLLSTVSGEGAKERTDRVLLTPWVRFLWESYRNMLELLKNNPTNLKVYSDVAKKAFKFCLNYQRRTEYRKLCDILRNHLTQAEKYQLQQHSLKLDQPEVIQCLVDIRFEQLESSIAVDLWQEAFRAIEEIHKLLTMSGKSPRPSLLENFYSRQAKVYMMAKNQLFHAAALHKLFVLRKEQKKTLTPEERQLTASQVLLSTLCVPIEPVPSETDRFLEVDDNSRDKARRLAALLRMDTPPSRATLMKDILHHNMLQLLPLELQQLYQHLEVEFNPLHLCQNVMPILESLEQQENLQQYVELLKQTTLVRLIKQISQVYVTIELSRLVELAPFTTTTDLEKVVVETATSNNIQVRIDHRTKSLCFGTDLNFSFKAETPEGPHIQSMPSEVLCDQLTIMSQALQQAVSIIFSSDIQREQLATCKKAYQDYQSHYRVDHRKTLQRGQNIEARKEFIESRSKAKEQKELDEKRQKAAKEREEEQKRLDREAENRKIERKKRELEEMQLKMKQERVDALKNTPVGKRAFADITNEELKVMDAEVIFSKQLKQIEKEKKDKEIKLKAQEKKIDYFERAKRLEELPLLKKQYEEQRILDKEFHEEQETQMITRAVNEREEAEEAHIRLKVMREDEARFRKDLKARRKEKFQEQMSKFQERLDAARVERLAQRKKERGERNKAEAIAAKKEEEARRVQLLREEEERRNEEERKKREAKQEEQRLKVLKREQEIEEKMRLRDQEFMEEKRRKEKDEIDESREGGRSGYLREDEPPQTREERGGWRGGMGDYGPNRGDDAWRRGAPRQGENSGKDDRDNWRGGGDEEQHRDDDWRSKRREEFRDDREGGWRRGGHRQEDEAPRRDERDSWRGRGSKWGDEDDWRFKRKEEESRRDDRDRDGWRGDVGGRDRGPPRRGYEGDRGLRRGYDGSDRRREEDRGRWGYDGDRSRRDDDRAWRRDGIEERDYGPRRDRDQRWDQERDRGREFERWERGPPRDSDRGDGRKGWGRDREDRGDRWRGERGVRADDRGGDRSPGRGDRGRDLRANDRGWKGSDRSPGRGDRGSDLRADDRGWRRSDRSPGRGDRGSDLRVDDRGWKRSDRSPGRGDRGSDLRADDRGWKGSDRSPGRGDRGSDLRADDRGWRRSDRSPGRGDRGSDLRAGDRGWRRSDRSPGRGDRGGDMRVEDSGGRGSDRSPRQRDKGRDLSPRQQFDEEGFEVVNRRR